jgi:type IV secretory pathway VirB2 component (pilin)
MAVGLSRHSSRFDMSVAKVRASVITAHCTCHLSSRSSGRTLLAVAVTCVLSVVSLFAAATATADNKRLNDGVIANVFTIQRQAGCATDRIGFGTDLRLQLAAQWHARDVLSNRALTSDAGSDGSTPAQRAVAAGFTGPVAQTVAINPALAISGLEVITMWHHNPRDLAIMQDCQYTKMGVWSENSLDRTVLVAMYGRPE